MNLSVVKYAPSIQTEDRQTVHKHLDFLASVDYYFYCSVLYKHTFFIVPPCGFKLKFFPFKFKKVHLLTCSVLLFFFCLIQHPKTTCMHEMCFFNTADVLYLWAAVQQWSPVQFKHNKLWKWSDRTWKKKRFLKHRTTCSVKICKSCHCINTFAPCTGHTMTNPSQPLSQHCEIPD